MTDRGKMINELTFQLHSKEVIEHHDPIQLSVTDANKILKLLKEQEPETRLYTAEEMQHLPDRKTVCIEMLVSREDEERGYITGCGWGVVWNSTGAEDGGTIVGGLFGSFFPNTITKIPFRACITSDGKSKVRLYRFWTNRPTLEQSKAVKWDE